MPVQWDTAQRRLASSDVAPSTQVSVTRQTRLLEMEECCRESGASQMTRMKTLACSVCLILVGVAPVAADNDAPKSLRMRAKKAPGSHWTPVQWAKRIAQ